MEISAKPTFENADVAPLLDVNASMWLQLAPNLAEKHPECVPALKEQARRKFSGRQLESILFKLDKPVIVPGLDRYFQMLRKPYIPITSAAPPVEERPQLNTVAGDPESARLAVALKLSAQLRVYFVMLQMTRETNVNRILRKDLAARLSQMGINVSEGARRWLYQGKGIFWNLSETHVYLIGQVRVALNLVKLAVERKLINLIGTNRPGKRGMYIDVSGSLQQFEASTYAAWYAHRENPTIARSTLAALWNREPRILRQWEKLAGVDVITSEAQYHPEHFADVPEHAYMYQAAIGGGRSETRFRARMVNTYHSPSIKQHHKRGQSRRVFHAVTEYLESIQPAGNCEQGEGSNAPTGGLKPTGRRYFTDSKKARSSAKRSGNRERYISLGTDKHGRAIFDYAPDGIQRTVKSEELPLITQFHFTRKLVYAKDVIYA